MIMEPVAIFLIFLLLALIVFYVSRPFFERSSRRAVESSQETSTLLAEREQILNALQELDFDQTLGKIPEEDYPIQRALLLQKGTRILRQLDEVVSRGGKPAGGTDLDGGSEPLNPRLISDDDVEDLLSHRRKSRVDKTAGFCPNCGKPVLQSDAFCPSCGNTLK
jgi:hypothetical protein